MAFTKTTSQIVQRVFEDFLPSWWDKTGVNLQVYTGLSGQISEITSNFDGLSNEISINTTSGNFLDEFGKLFKLARTVGESDESYRLRIKSYFQAFSGGGSSEGMKNAISLITGYPTSSITVTDIAPLIFSVDISIGVETDIFTLGIFQPIIEQVKAAGTYNQAINFVPLNDVFFINLSDANGDNLII